MRISSLQFSCSVVSDSATPWTARSMPGFPVHHQHPEFTQTHVHCAEQAMATHFSTFAWKIPWTEEPGRLESMGSKSRTRLSDFTFTPWRRKWQPSPVFLPGECQGRGSLVGCHLWGRTESDTTERLSSSSSSSQQAPLPYFLGVFQLFSVLCPFLLLLLFFFFLIAFRIRLTGTTKTLLGFDPDWIESRH